MWEIVPDNLGGYYVWRRSGLLFSIMMLIGLAVVGGFLLSIFLDKIYFEYGAFICITFAITSVMYFHQQYFKRPKQATVLSYALSYFVGPFFILFLIAGSFYWGTWADEIVAGSNKGEKILILLYMGTSPILAIIGGISITLLITITAGTLSKKYR